MGHLKSVDFWIGAAVVVFAMEVLASSGVWDWRATAADLGHKVDSAVS